MATSAGRAAGWGAALLFSMVGAPGFSADQGSPPGEGSTVKARTHLVIGEVVRLDARRHVLSVRTAETPPREIDITVEPTTRITAGGRTRSLEDIRPGARVSITCADGAGGSHSARLVTVRAGPATPAPSTAASPRS